MVLTVAVLDDDQFFADGLTAAVNRAPGGRARAVVTSLELIPRLVLNREADVLVIDARDLAHRRVLAQVRRRSRRVRLIAIVPLVDVTAVPALIAGASAVVGRDDAMRVLPATIEAVAVDMCALPQVLLDAVLERSGFPSDTRPGDGVDGLTIREREVLAHLMSGQDQRQIADSLDVSVHTVRSHVKRILSKLDAHSSLEAVAVAFRSGLQPHDLGASR